MKKNIIVVGCGFSGTIIAREIAERLNIPVRIIERRNHIAGNMYDYRDERNILCQKYGPHHFYTSNYEIIRYLEQFAEFFPHYCRSLNWMNGRYYTRPFNFMTVQEIVGKEKAVTLLRKLRNEYGGREERVPIYALMESADEDIAEYGDTLFNMAFVPYIAKMWDVPVHKIDKYVLGRRGMAIGYDLRDADYDFQGLPKEGFSKMFENMLDHSNITIQLDVDANDHIAFYDDKVLYDRQNVDCLIYTGAIDELFHFKYGQLPYRSLDIKWEYYNQEHALPVGIDSVSYPDAPGYVRKTEYRSMMYNPKEATGNGGGTTLSVEYPIAYNRYANIGNEPYYPVITENSKEIYNQYLNESKKYRNIFLCGRLAEFRYIDMHTCVEHALEYFNNIKDYLSK